MAKNTPTKRNVVVAIPKTIKLPTVGAKIKAITIDALESFSKVKRKKATRYLGNTLSEDDFKEGVKAVLEPQIAGEEIMHEPPRKVGDDPDSLDGVLASVQMDGEKRQHGRAKDMQPMFDLVDRHTGFVGVEDGFLG